MHALNHNGVAHPPFKIRMDNQMLTNVPLPAGYIQMPIFNHEEATLIDDLDLTGCDFVNNVDHARFGDDKTYSDYTNLTDTLREPFKHAFNMTEEAAAAMDFLGSYGKSDIVQSNVFEGLGYGYNYTLQHLETINQTVLETLILPMAEPVSARDMYVSKQMRLPLAMMERYVDGE